MPSNNDSAKAEQIRGNLEIPDEKELKKMDPVCLVSLLTSCDKDSVKFRVVELELNRRKYADISKANLYSIIIGAVIGAVFTVVGGVITNYSIQSHLCVCDNLKEGATTDSMGASIPLAIEPLRDREQTKHKQ